MYVKIVRLISFLLLIFLLLFGAYIFAAGGGISNIDNIVTSYQPTDTDTNYLTALSYYRGEGLYKNASSIYPPGRMLALSGLFNLFGASIPTGAFYFNFFPALFYSPLLFFLSFLIFSNNNNNNVVSLLFSTITVWIDLTLIRTAQEIHVITVLFFVLFLTPFKWRRIKNLLLGVLFGLVFLFRIEAGIFLILALIIPNLRSLNKINVQKYAILGLFSVWLPILSILIRDSSIVNFFNDVVILGLIAQPKTMAQAIQPDHIPLFTAVLIFTISSGLALFLKIKKLPIQSFAIFSVLSFATALSRSDEGHLWYGASLISIYITHILISSKQLVKFFNIDSSIKITIFSVFFFFLGKSLIFLKSPSIYVIASLLLFFLIPYFSKRIDWKVIQIAGLIATLAMFHSISYIRLRYSPLRPYLSIPKYSSDFFKDEEDEIAGLIFPKKDIETLKKISFLIPKSEKYIYIFPNHFLYYEFFNQSNPTRYFYNNNERTDAIEKEIVANFKETNTKYYLIFSKQAKLKGGPVWKWIQLNTYTEQEFTLNDESVQLRKII